MLLSHIKCWNWNPFTSEREKCLDMCVCVCVCVCVCTRVNVWMYACFEPVKEAGEGKRMWKWEGDNFYIIISFKYSCSSCQFFFFK